MAPDTVYMGTELHLHYRAEVLGDTGPPPFSISYTSTSLTSILACAIPMMALMYLAAISWLYRYSLANPRPINKVSGYRLQRYAPGFYIFLVLMSLTEFANSTWLLVQYGYLQNYPGRGARSAIIFLLFAACWTTITAATFSALFIHPSWSRFPVASVGSQVLWIFVTWLFWIIGSGLLNGALPSVLVKGNCTNIVYCGQIRSLFAIGIIESLSFTSSMVIVIWLAWKSTRDTLHPSLNVPLGQNGGFRVSNP